jgi:nitronate monooxygenase
MCHPRPSRMPNGARPGGEAGNRPGLFGGIARSREGGLSIGAFHCDPKPARIESRVPAEFRLSDLPTPIVQAGMGAVARHELAAAVSEAGGLGTIAGAQAPIAEMLAAARRLTDKPIAVNLLLPFVRPGDVEAASDADVLVTFWGAPRRLAAGFWVHQCGSVDEARAAVAAGADAVIAQGVEAGGHMRGSTPLLDLLEQTIAAVQVPVFAAGGICDVDDVKAVLAAGAVAAVSGTRFLLSDESHAHPEYKRRCLDASETIVTELFGMAWPDASHRVIPNAATRRWTRADERGPGWVRAANRASAPLAARVSPGLQARALRTQRASRPFFGPQPPTDDGPGNLLDAGPLYAGMHVTRITDIRPAAELVRALTP